jgi:hypothetical protein
LNDHVFHDSDPQRLADLLRIGTSGAKLWHADEWRELLRHELASLPAAQWPRLRTLLEHADPPIRTLSELLGHGDPPREAMRYVHDAYRAMDDETLPPQVVKRIVRIAAARLAGESRDTWRKWFDDV